MLIATRRLRSCTPRARNRTALRGTRSDTRAFGQRLADAFAAERATIRKVIEEQMRRASTLSADAFAAESLPQLGIDSDAARASTTPSTRSRVTPQPVAVSLSRASPPGPDITLVSPSVPPAAPSAATRTPSIVAFWAVAVLVFAAIAYALWPAAPSGASAVLPAGSATLAASVAPALSGQAPATPPVGSAQPSPAASSAGIAVSPGTSPVAVTAKPALRPVVAETPKPAESAVPPAPSATATATATPHPSLDIRLSR